MSLNLPLCRHEHSSSFVIGDCPQSFPHSAKDWGLAFKVTDVIEKRGSGEKKIHILCTISAIFSVISLTFLASLSGQQQTEAGAVVVVFSFSPQHFLIMLLEMAWYVSQSEPGHWCCNEFSSPLRSAESFGCEVARSPITGQSPLIGQFSGHNFRHVERDISCLRKLFPRILGLSINPERLCSRAIFSVPSVMVKWGKGGSHVHLARARVTHPLYCVSFCCN